MCLPSLFQRTEARPVLGFGVKAFNRVKQLPVGAPTHGIDLLIHWGIAADLKEKTSQSVWGEVHCGKWITSSKFCLVPGQVWTRVVLALGAFCVVISVTLLGVCVCYTVQTNIIAWCERPKIGNNHTRLSCRFILDLIHSQNGFSWGSRVFHVPFYRGLKEKFSLALDDSLIDGKLISNHFYFYYFAFIS